MIKSFKTFFDGKLLESNLDEEQIANEDVVRDENMYNFLNSNSPEFISDDRFFSKIAKILKKRIIANGLKASVYPYIITIDNERGILLKISNGYSIICFKNSYNKKVELFKEFDINAPENTSIISLSTTSKGFKDIVDTIIMIINDGNGNEIHESLGAIDNMPIAIPWPKIVKSLKDCPIDTIKELLHEFASKTDLEIKKKFMSVTPGDDDVYGVVREYLGGFGSSEIVWNRLVAAMHLMLCGAVPTEAVKYCDDIPWVGIAAGHETIGDVSDELDGFVPEETSIDVSAGKKVKVTSAAEKLDAKIAELDMDMDTVATMADAMCKVIKSNGNDDKLFKRKFGLRRGLLVTGLAGIGKTTGIESALKKNNMQEYVDYYVMGPVSTGANELYYTFYQNANSLIIFDDTPEMFDTELKIASWKAAIAGNERGRVLTRPQGTIKSAQEARYDGMFYNVGDMDRQDRYFKEIGKKTPEEKAEWLAKEKKKIIAEGTKKDPETGRTIAEISESDAAMMAKRNWINKESKNLNPLIPDRFTFNGLVIIVTNLSFDTFKKSAKDHWEALSRRLQVIEIAPDYPTVWGWLKKKLQYEIENNIDDSLRLIPSIYVEDFIKFVDEIMEGKHNSLDGKKVYGVINFGTIADMNEMMTVGVADGEPFDSFKSDILREMRKTK